MPTVDKLITHPEYLTDFFMWLVLVVFFIAFTKNVQITTLDIGKRLYGAEPNSTGIQDAITPTWQTRNNIISFVLLFAFIGTSLYVFKWYAGLGIFLMTLFVVIPLVSNYLMYPPSSVFIVKKIRNNLVKKQKIYFEKGDSLRAEAVSEILIRLDEITNLD